MAGAPAQLERSSSQVPPCNWCAAGWAASTSRAGAIPSAMRPLPSGVPSRDPAVRQAGRAVACLTRSNQAHAMSQCSGTLGLLTGRACMNRRDRELMRMRLLDCWRRVARTIRGGASAHWVDPRRCDDLLTSVAVAAGTWSNDSAEPAARPEGHSAKPKPSRLEAMILEGLRAFDASLLAAGVNAAQRRGMLLSTLRQGFLDGLAPPHYRRAAAWVFDQEQREAVCWPAWR